MKKYYLMTFLILITLKIYPQLLNLEKGEVYKLNIIDSTNIIAVENENINNVIMTSEINIIFKVKDYKKQNYLIEAYYENIRMSSKLPEGEINLQSDFNDPFSLELKKLINKPFEIVLSNNGNIIELNIDSIFSEKNEYFNKIKQEFGEKSLRHSLELCFLILPNKTPELKNKWTINRHFGKAIPENIREEFEFIEENDNSYRIISNGFISSSKNVMTMNNDSSFVKNNFIGDVNTEYTINKNSGWIKKAFISHRKIGEVSNNNSKVLMSINRNIFIIGKQKATNNVQKQ